MPTDAPTIDWSFIEEMAKAYPPGETPIEVAWQRQGFENTRAEFKRIDEALDVQGGQLVNLVGKLDTVSLAVDTLPQRIAEQVMAQSARELDERREARVSELEDRKEARASDIADRKEARKERFALLRYLVDRVFDAINTLVSNKAFAVLLGTSILLASAGIFLSQAGVRIGDWFEVDTNRDRNVERLEDYAPAPEPSED